MAPCTMTVRNTCPFKVTFYALGGPVLCDIKPRETRTSEACAIWFSTRVQGPGTIFYSDEWEALKHAYLDNAAAYAGDAWAVEEGGMAAVVGSVLGLALCELGEVFKLHNTKESIGNGKHNIYYADKMEGVYGNSNILIYATLDPACELTPNNPEKIWNLHLVRDNGQESPGVVDSIPVYKEPDLTSYESSMFFRLMSKGWNKRLFASDDPGKLHMRNVDVAFDPIHFAEYWAILPAESAQTDLKIVNVKTNRWLTQFSAETDKWIGLYSTGFRDEKDQHWKVAVTGQGDQYNPSTTVNLINCKTNDKLTCDGDAVFGTSSLISYGVVGFDYSDWIVETMCVNLDNIPDKLKVRIMEASTGKYLVQQNTYDVVLESLGADTQLFSIERMPTDAHPDGFLLVKGHSSNGKTYRISFKNGKLSINDDASLSNDVWVSTVAGTRSGLRLSNPTSGGILTHKSGVFTMQTDECKEQLFVMQLSKYT